MTVHNLRSKQKKILVLFIVAVSACLITASAINLQVSNELSQALETCINGVGIHKATLIPSPQDPRRTDLNVTIIFQNPSKFLLKINYISIEILINDQAISNMPPSPQLEIPSGQTMEFWTIIPIFDIAGIAGNPPYKVSGTGTIGGQASYLFVTVSKTQNVYFLKFAE